MKYKIVIVIDVIENITGGAERQVYELLKAIDRQKFDVWLYVLHQKEVPVEIQNFQLPITNVQSISNDQSPMIRIKTLGINRIYDIEGIREGMRFSRFLKEEKIDAVMTYHFASDIWGTYFAKKARVPVIISNRRDEGFWRNTTHIKAYKWVNKWVDKVIAVSKAVQKMAIEEGIPEDKVELLYSGVDLTRFDVKVDIAAKRKEIGVPVDAKLIACVGNFNPIKGHGYLIDAMVDVLKHIPNVHLMLIGDGVLRQSYELRVTGYGLEKNVHFLGKRNDVPELLLSSDLCVLPSLSEGLSNALIEYMAAGKPVIATRVGGNPDVIEDGVNGILVEAKDSGALSQKILQLILDSRCQIQDQDTKIHDERLKQSLRPTSHVLMNEVNGRPTVRELAANARRTVEERFDLKKQIKDLQDFIGREIQRSKNPRVLHLISSGGLFGAERVMLSLGKAMNMNGSAVWLGALRNSHNPHLEIIEEAKQNNIPYGVFDSKGQVDFSTANRIACFIRERKISLIHTHNYKATVLAVLVSWKTGVSVLSTTHGWVQVGKKLKLYEWFERILLKFFVKRVVAVSDAIKQDMLKAGISEDKIEVVYNGIDTETTQDSRLRTHDLRKEFGITERTIVIATIARLSPEKGHTYLFQAAQRILKERSDVVFLIAGDGALRKDLEKEAAQRGIQKNVVFTGYRTDMDAVYASADIVVQPSLREGIPITLLEAMSRGKTIVATDVGGVAGLIHDSRTGLLVPSGSVDALYKSLMKVIQDFSLRRILGDNALSLVKEKYSLEKMVNKYKDIYREILDTRC